MEQNTETEKHEQARLTVQHMAVNATGARPGDVLMGVRKNLSKDAIMKIVEGEIPPFRDDLENVQCFPDLWEQYLNKLGSLEFFKAMSLGERAEWVEENARSGDFDLAEVDDVYVEVIDVGSGTFLTLEPDTVTMLLAGNPDREDRAWLLSDVREQFPKKPGSRARRHTLIFFLHFWKISSPFETVDSFGGLVYDLAKSKFVKGSWEPVTLFSGLAKLYQETKKGFEVAAKTKIGISHIKTQKGELPYFAELIKKFPKQTMKDVDFVRDRISFFTAAGYKSLLQKIIRYAPEFVKFGSRNVNADFVCCVVFTLLLVHSGSFVPDIQRFVTGQESALKRLAVIILEDSYSSESNKLLKLGVLAFLAQRLSGWKLPIADYREVLDLILKALNTPLLFEHNVQKGFEMAPYVLDLKNSDLANFSALLDDIKSFATDLAMTRFIAFNGGRSPTPSVNETYFKLKRPPEMFVDHCIDQHWAPEIAYFLPIEIIDEYRVVEAGSKPFAKLFKAIFVNVTGVNSRRPTTGLTGRKVTASPEFIDAVKRAQYLTFLAKAPSQISEVQTTGETYLLRSKLDKSWISGLVGPIDVGRRPPIMVTMKPDDPLQLVAIKKPSRGLKDGTLTDEQIENSLAEAKALMSAKGMYLTTATPPVPYLKEYRMFLINNRLEFRRGSQPPMTWAALSKVEMDLPTFEMHKELTLEKTLSTVTVQGVAEDAMETFDEILKGYDVHVIRRLLSYLTSYRSHVEVARLSKDGGGVAQAVVVEDVGACQLLLYLSALFPAALGRQEGYASRFHVINAPLLWDVKNKCILPNLENCIKCAKGEGKWKKFEDCSGREVRSYQADSLQEMIAKNKKNKKGHFLWAPVGVGKTMIVLSYLKDLATRARLPKYVIYTLPKSALKSILTEIEYFGVPVNLLLPIKSWKKHPEANLVVNATELEPWRINIIEHDHLRLLEEQLISKAHESVFVIDEVHKALNDTKRTSTALEVSRLSADFVAMTGTPIVDSNTYKLIWWLEQIVEFEVNDKNFWVAANGMIARKVNTGVLVDKTEVVANFTEKERVEYQALVPAGLGGINQRASNKDISLAFDVCYRAADRKMVEVVLAFLKEEKAVMLVARNSEHQKRLKSMLIAKNLKEDDIYLLEKDSSIFLTDETVEDGTTPDYKVAIVPLRKSEGYTLTRMCAQVTSVYPSNNATREQLEGRINRLSQNADTVHYRVVHCGILTYVLQHHKDAASLSAVLNSLAKEIEIEE